MTEGGVDVEVGGGGGGRYGGGGCKLGRPYVLRALHVGSPSGQIYNSDVRFVKCPCQVYTHVPGILLCCYEV